MNLQVKFSLIFLLVFGVQLGVAGYVCDGFLQRSARDQVIRQARLMMESSLAARTYTDQQIKPLVNRNDPVFHPQIVPAYAATEHLNYFRNAYPEYSYKEATLNPTNPRDRAVDWEPDIVNFFRSNAPPSAEPASGVVWEPAMLEKTKRELAVYIGPMAKFIVDSTASEVHTVKDFYDALCRAIPSSQDRERFLSRCKAGI